MGARSDMRFCSSAEVRAADEAAIQAGTSGRELMRRAARGIALELTHLLRTSGKTHPQLHLIAGRGNNGGDAIAAACLLHEAGWAPCVRLAADPAALKGEPAFFLSQYRSLGGRLMVAPDESDWPTEPGRLPLADIVVDGLLGTGARGAPTGVTTAAVRWIHALAQQARVVALDFPSGVDATTGAASDPHVQADITLCIGLPKHGLAVPTARQAVGSVVFVDIGLKTPPATENEPRLLTASVARPPVRSRAAHKGIFGRMLVIGGSPGLSGAAGLAACGALASGVGWVEALVPDDLVETTSALATGAMVHAGALGREGTLSQETFAQWESRIAHFDAIVAGPGLGHSADTLALLRRLLLVATCPLVFDADALNAFAGRAHWIEKRSGPMVITPHPGEAARLLGTTTDEVQANRMGTAHRLLGSTSACVVLKGDGTLVLDKGHPPLLNLNGNPGLSRGGTGDILAGLIGGLLAQKMPVRDAAALAVWLHGRAGDLAAWQKGVAAMAVSDVIAALPQAWVSAHGVR